MFVSDCSEIRGSIGGDGTMKLKLWLTTACLTLVLTTFSQAATFDYTYLFGDGRTITGSVDGALQGDLNTVAVSSFTQPLLDGGSLPIVLTDLGNAGAPGTTPTFTLDGVGLSFSLTANGNNDGITFLDGGFAAVFGFNGGPPFEIYSSASWSAVERINPVPLPAGGLLLLSGLMGVAGLLHRKKHAA